MFILKELWSMDKLDAKQFREMLKSGCANLNNHASEINTLNVFPVPDGDTGTNMSMTFTNGYNEAEKCVSDNLSEVAKSFSRGLLMGARGNSGVITSQIFRGFYQSIDGKETIGVQDIADAFVNGSAVAYKAIMKPVEGTILTVIRESSENTKQALEENPVDINGYFTLLCENAKISLDHTPEILPVLKEVGVVDSGGAGLLKIFEGFKAYIDGKPFELNVQNESQSNEEFNPALLLENEEFGYCTEFIVRLDDSYIKTFDEQILKRKLTDMGGESLVVVKDDDLVKVHVHTLKPGDALNIGQRYGEFVKLKIENMQEQHSSIINSSSTQPKQPIEKPKQKYGIIVVSSGEGVDQLFKDLGADVIISGGQTMNPSTEDFVREINNLNNCEYIFIFPNNSNIILASKQAQAICEGRNIYVVETKSVLAGLSAVGMFNREVSPDQNYNDLNDVIANVDDYSITYAVKDTVFEGVKVKKGDYMAIGKKDIIATGKNRKKVLFKLLDNIFKDSEKDLLTIVVGEDVDDKEVKELNDYLSKNTDMETEVIIGKQPIYSYLIGLE